MAELMTAVLLERGGRALVARRRRGPFAGQYLLPLAGVRETEAAEDALRRHTREQFGLEIAPGAEGFVETLYLAEGDAQYVVNIFRAPPPDGPLRFDSQGDYDGARWVAGGELGEVAMPPDLRIPLAQILAAPDALHELDWEGMGAALAAGGSEAKPLAERAAGAAEPAMAVVAEDNRAGWDAISEAYQSAYYGDRDAGRLKWSWGLFEDELGLLDDMRGKRALVLGCGGGQDVAALAGMGAVAVGIDRSSKQVAYARRYLGRHGVVNGSVVEGDVTDLSRFDDGSFDVAISVHVLGYVEQADAAVAEAARVLRPGGQLVLVVNHPLGMMLDDAAPYAVVRPYWTRRIAWRWTIGDAGGDLVDYGRTLEEWFTMLTEAGLTVEGIVEPRQGDVTGDDATWLDVRLAKLAPVTLILKARKR